MSRRTEWLRDMVMDDVHDAFYDRNGKTPFTGGGWKIISITTVESGVLCVLDVDDEAHDADGQYKREVHDLIIYAWYKDGTKLTAEPQDITTNTKYRIQYYATVLLRNEPVVMKPDRVRALYEARRTLDELEPTPMERLPKHWYCVTQDPRFQGEAYEDTCFTEYGDQVYGDGPFDLNKWCFAHDLGALWHGADDEPVYGDGFYLRPGDLIETLGPDGTTLCSRFVLRRPTAE